MKRSDILFLILFVAFIPTWLFISLQEYFDPILMLVIYPLVTIPLYMMKRKEEKKEEQKEKLK